MPDGFDFAVAGSILRVRPLEPADSIEGLTDLLHRAYAPLARQGMPFVASHQTPDQTLRRVRKGECLVGTLDGRLVATVTWHPPGISTGTPWYERPGVATFGQFAVEPDLQRRGVGGALLRHVEDRARAAGASELALNTAEPAAELIRYYERRGFRFIETVQWTTVPYRSVVMSKTLGGC